MDEEVRQDYEPAAYWEERLRRRFDLTGVGHGSLGPGYNTRLYRARRRALDRALRAVGRDLGGRRVLDIGCGSGFYTEYSLEKGAGDYVGIDITRVSIETLRLRYPDFQFMIGDVSSERLIMEAPFDLILAADVLFHIVDDQAFSRALANIAAWLSPGGVLILSDVFPETTLQTAAHCRYRSRDTYRTLLERSSLRISHMEPIFALLQPPPYGVRASPLWRTYAWIWRYGWRVARLRFFDRILPVGLGWLDDAVALKAFGRNAPNAKWLVAVKDDVA